VTIFEVPFFKNSLRVTASESGVSEILWQRRRARESRRPCPLEKRFRKALRAYLSGSGSLDVPIDWRQLEGTDFQKKVWKKMWAIPYGETRSYGEIAKSLRKPGAARAVGTACGKNPVLLAIPCHRVVGTSGLGGFSGGGLPVKKQLLQLEHQQL
jgi:methylated-DNA-[protein]-cysteine S-methyltransferase